MNGLLYAYDPIKRQLFVDQCRGELKCVCSTSNPSMCVAATLPTPNCAMAKADYWEGYSPLSDGMRVRTYGVMRCCMSRSCLWQPSRSVRWLSCGTRRADRPETRERTRVIVSFIFLPSSALSFGHAINPAVKAWVAEVLQNWSAKCPRESSIVRRCWCGNPTSRVLQITSLDATSYICNNKIFLIATAQK